MTSTLGPPATASVRDCGRSVRASTSKPRADPVTSGPYADTTQQDYRMRRTQQVPPDVLGYGVASMSTSSRLHSIAPSRCLSILCPRTLGPLFIQPHCFGFSGFGPWAHLCLGTPFTKLPTDLAMPHDRLGIIVTFCSTQRRVPVRSPTFSPDSTPCKQSDRAGWR